ncbi:phosphate acyltransferase PlsX [Clostridium facile]|uniref:Phosphate acyltransferase n=1 Tax=Clostridium facile TaxID=2763035 RepID=A0ABR7IRG7_9CLOT|nr:phosphate acyltransferase PlsX [Clostridium facile]MBC5787744.1 phosphate acyltransferase PlsX [Clostridium facile]
MRVIVDAFGGDDAPLAVLQGCELALKEYDGVEITLVGDIPTMKKVASEHQIDLSQMELIQADDIFDIHTDPVEIRRSMSNSSMAVGLKELAAGNGDAFLSAGSTGALLVGATAFVKRIKGVKRAALAPIMPSATGCFMLIDGGANLDCRPEMLQQFGLMGSIYINKIMEVPSPRVGLANIGAEETKGGELQLEAYQLLKQSNINFIGNVEARDIPLGACDVVVADGFAGNMILKSVEGMGALMIKELKDMFFASTKTKIAALLLKGQLKQFKKRMDYTEYGGAPLMGIAKPVIKAHGSSNPNAFKNAIRQAKEFVQKEVIHEIIANL